MGYDTDRFTSDVNDALTCCICRDVLEDPVQSPCEHAYCRSCIQAWLVNEVTCPEDRQSLSEAMLRPLHRYMRNDLNRLRLRCKNAAYGCEIITALEFLDSHETDCPYHRQKCPNERCAYYGSRRDLASHIVDCEYSETQCPKGCGLVLSHPSDKNHSCVQELKTSIDVLRSEMTCKYEDLKREMELRLDMQRGHMVQKEAVYQSQIDALNTETAKMTQNVKLLMDLELTRRRDIEKLEEEKKELQDLLKEHLRSQICSGGGTSSASGSTNSSSRLKRSNTFYGKESTI